MKNLQPRRTSEGVFQYDNSNHSRLTIFILAVPLIIFVLLLSVEGDNSTLKALALTKQNSTGSGNNLTDLLPITNRNVMSLIQFQQYKDPQDRFTINYPTDWKVKPASNRFEDITVEFSSPSNTKENLTTVSVKIVPNLFSPNIDLGNVLNSMIKSSIGRTVPSFALEEDVECKNYNFTGKQACSFIYTSESKTAFLQVTTNIGDTEYTVTYRAPSDNFDAGLPIAERMIHSFNITRST